MSPRTPAALVIGALLSGCAVVSYDLAPDANACRTPDGKLEVAIRHVQTVRGSLHTPFDYSNRSTASWIYFVKVPSAEIAEWNVQDLEVRSETSPLKVTSGTVSVKSTFIQFNITVASARAGAGKGTTIKGVLAEWGSAKLSQALSCPSR